MISMLGNRFVCITQSKYWGPFLYSFRIITFCSLFFEGKMHLTGKWWMSTIGQLAVFQKNLSSPACQLLYNYRNFINRNFINRNFIITKLSGANSPIRKTNIVIFTISLLRRRDNLDYPRRMQDLIKHVSNTSDGNTAPSPSLLQGQGVFMVREYGRRYCCSWLERD